MEATEQLLDESGWVPALDADKLQERARECFAPEVAERFRLSEPEAAIITAWRAMRNYVAHGSAASREEVNEALANPALPLVFRKPTAKEVHSVGAFLKAPGKSGDAARLLHYFNAMEALGRRFSGIQRTGTGCPVGRVELPVPRSTSSAKARSLADWNRR